MRLTLLCELETSWVLDVTVAAAYWTAFVHFETFAHQSKLYIEQILKENKDR